MVIKNLEEISSSNEDFDLKKLFSTKNVDLMHIVLKPSEVIDRQIQPLKSVFYVLSGRAIIEAGTERKVVEKHNVIEIDPNTEIGWINAFEEDLEIIILKLKG